MLNCDIIDKKTGLAIDYVFSLYFSFFTRNCTYIECCIKKALDSGITEEEILNVLYSYVGDEKLVQMIILVVRSLQYEVDSRHPCISIIDDCKE